jgi:endo-1,4-beta-xylanase
MGIGLALAALLLASQAADPAYGPYLESVQKALPVRGAPVFDGARLSDFNQGGRGDAAAYSVVPVTGQPFAQAIRIQVPKRTDPPWTVQLQPPPGKEPLRKGDRILVVLNARCTESPDGRGIVNAILQASQAPWTGLGSISAAPRKEWRRFFLLGAAGQDFAAGGYGLTLHLGNQAQTLEVGGVVALKLPGNVDEKKLPFNEVRYPGEEPDAPWRRAARERIEKHRKGDLVVEVRDAAGRPVAGAEVRVRMKRHAYGFGTFLEPLTVGEGPDADRMREWTLRLFNRCTTPIYWADWGWASPQTRERYHRMAQWAKDNGLETRGHVIIYPSFQFMPFAVRALEKDPAALRKRVAEQVVETVEATKKYAFRDYDVTNELRDCTDLHRICGKDVVPEWYRLARLHNPVTRMAINENTILTQGGATESQQDTYAGWIEYLAAQGQAADVIGFQGHFGENVTAPDRVLAILDRFAKYGKPLHVTEFDILARDEEGQGRYTRDFLTTIFSHPATEAFTCWGFWEGQMWQPPGAMVRKDWTPKPNGRAWMDLVLKEWWTDLSGRTGESGAFAARGFLGDYEITVSSRGSSRTAKARLAAAGSRVAVTLD